MGNQLLSIDLTACPEAPAPELKGAGSYLVAWDPVKQKAAWTQREGNGRSGTMTTAGNLVFQGTEEGPAFQGVPKFTAFRADNGEKVWSVDSQAQAVGGPVSYLVGDTQYVAVVAAGAGGFGGSYWQPNYARLLVYKLDGKATLPPKKPVTPPELNPPPNFGDAALLTRGEKQYDAHCASCHGASDQARVSSLFPDLRYASELWNSAAFDAIVIGGALQDDGMVSFRQYITPEDADAIRAYVVREANVAKAAPKRAGFRFPGFARCGRPTGPAATTHASTTAGPGGGAAGSTATPGGAGLHQ
jgi:mono/diheme cytochrome c family protein